jgi:hypothetical protein
MFQEQVKTHGVMNKTPQGIPLEAISRSPPGRGCCVLLQQREELLLECYGNQVLKLISH